jgi:hypothetical protein
MVNSTPGVNATASMASSIRLLGSSRETTAIENGLFFLAGKS